jgi:carbamate kinase
LVSLVCFVLPVYYYNDTSSKDVPRHIYMCMWGTLLTALINTFQPASSEAMREFTFPAGSMGPEVDAACHFAEATGKSAGN